MRISYWSSDVCSSDLYESDFSPYDSSHDFHKAVKTILEDTPFRTCTFYPVRVQTSNPQEDNATHRPRDGSLHVAPLCIIQIGRASCREECVSTCRSRWALYNKTKKTQTKIHKN